MLPLTPKAAAPNPRNVNYLYNVLIAHVKLLNMKNSPNERSVWRDPNETRLETSTNADYRIIFLQWCHRLVTETTHHFGGGTLYRKCSGNQRWQWASAYGAHASSEWTAHSSAALRRKHTSVTATQRVYCWQEHSLALSHTEMSSNLTM